QEVAKRMMMRANGNGKPPYRIINIASVAGLRVLPQIGLYSMSKAAVVHMTRAMANEWGRHGINVNAICPGYIDTEINHYLWDTEQGQKLQSMLPRRRRVRPDRHGRRMLAGFLRDLGFGLRRRAGPHRDLREHGAGGRQQPRRERRLRGHAE
ncbi:SDR family oxidoreductase, partial [Paraburkholderia phenazinium]|uniref:SDR family oxidoreductase n=1 Tax=Paraburkholderia phenazinium TaxID=60549 RepID=UPI001FC955B7